ncbi:hypothetical protein GRF29_154g140011 [Pseudopithomyces chartarum]|uniref:Elongator complex protein 4 n=1 Tax=Pseudopithomyces chartarum TaxID=1892770 RepID=A0AAN6RD20_9PLEO|nr:hypothetical protein GRF29_154g140011 [Pseudopithomyces chartarum]
MAFRKRNTALTRTSDAPASPSSPNPPASPTSIPPPAPQPGTRPSPIDGRLTTSTGTPSLDAILAGHAGLPLGNSILIGESGTTDYAGALLRFYAAEGVVQGHKDVAGGIGTPSCGAVAAFAGVVSGELLASGGRHPVLAWASGAAPQISYSVDGDDHAAVDAVSKVVGRGALDGDSVRWSV